MKKVISAKKAPEAIGPYSQAIEVNGMLFISGMLPIDPTTGNLVAGEVREQTDQIFINIKAVLTAAEMKLEHIVKTTVFLNDMSLFDGMNQVYSTYFTKPYPARSTIAVKTLPKDALVEIEVIAVK